MTELLRYEVPGKGRHYIHPLDGHRMPSVTNVLGVLPKPWLAAWAAKEERALVVRTAAAVYSSLNGEVLEAEYAKRLGLELPHKKAHATIRDSAGDDGTQAHAMIEWLIQGMLGVPEPGLGPGQGIQETVRCGVDAWVAWQKEVGFRPAHAEKRLYSDDLDTAGTTDVICAEVREFSVPIAVLADWKLTNAIRPEAEIQVAVLRHMAIERGLLDADSWGLVMRLPKVPDEAVETRYLDPCRCEYLVEVFRSARKIWDWANSK